MDCWFVCFAYLFYVRWFACFSFVCQLCVFFRLLVFWGFAGLVVHSGVCLGACVFARMCLFGYLFACRSVCLPGCMSAHVFVCWFACMYTHLLARLGHICMSAHVLLHAACATISADSRMILQVASPTISADSHMIVLVRLC